MLGCCLIAFVSPLLADSEPVEAATSPQESHGFKREIWTELKGSTEESLTNIPAFIGPPYSLTTTEQFYQWPSFEDFVAPSVNGDHYGMSHGIRLRAYLTPPESGDYIFSESSASSVAVYLSIDVNPYAKRLVLSHNALPKGADTTAVGNQFRSRAIRLQGGSRYYLEVLQKNDSGPEDLALNWQSVSDGNVSTPESIPLSALAPYAPPSPNPPGLLREFYLNMDGISVADLKKSAAFYRIPDKTDILAGSSHADFGENYGMRLRGYVTAPVSGEYRFWECGSGGAVLMLSTDETSNAIHQSVRLSDRANKKQIAGQNNITNPLQFGKGASQGSKPVTMIAGKKYYMELILKTGTGGDHAAIAWKVPGRESELIPLSALESFRRPDTDLDDDGMPDSLEKLYGFNPTDAADAGGDPDGDGVFNDEEIAAGSDPNIYDSVPGMVLSDLWSGAEGIMLDQRTFQVAFTRPPTATSAPLTTSVHAGGNNFVRRTRGFIIPPVDGEYTFWAGATGECTFSLFTTDSKFDRKLLIRTSVRNPYATFDIDASQKSQSVTLTAGKKYYFELWNKHGDVNAPGGKTAHVSLAWMIPTDRRRLVASRFLATFPGEANDFDEDDLPDDWELANGLNPRDDGRAPNSKEGTFGDLDGDGLTNLAERNYGTRTDLADTDEDGMNDYDEILAHSEPQFKDGARYTATIKGDAYTANSGDWQKKDGSAYQNSRRGSVTYPITVPAGNLYVLKFRLASRADGGVDETYHCRVSINGQLISFEPVYMIENGSAYLAVLTPWLNSGETYQCELFIDNSYNYRRVSVDALQIIAAGGPDTNNNGRPDWVDIRLRDTNGFDQRIIHSRTSPASVEGRAHYPGLTDTYGLTVTKAPGGRFFTDVPLNAEAPTELTFDFENKAHSQSCTIDWQPTNLKQFPEESITLREGDSLLCTAFKPADTYSNARYTLLVNGNSYTNYATVPTPITFPTPGVQQLQVLQVDSSGDTSDRTIIVNVLPKIALEPPVFVSCYTKTWSPRLPSGTQLQFDDSVLNYPEPNGAYTVMTTNSLNQPLLIRDTASGRILGGSEVKSFSLRTSHQTGCFYEEAGNPISTIGLPVVISGDTGGSEIRCVTIIGGVTFLDGTTSTSRWAKDFDDFGVTTLYFLKPNTAHSNCRRFTVWKDGACIAR